MGTSVRMLLTRQSLSACAAISGNRSEIHRPLAPRWRNSHRGASSFALGTRPRPIAVPACRTSAGLWSNESTCDGPPSMQRNTTRLARAGKWGGRVVPAASSAASALKATPPKPAATVASQ